MAFLLLGALDARRMHAQIIAGTSTDHVVGNGTVLTAALVEHTGTDYVYYNNTAPNEQCTLKVFTWDGSSSGFGWEFGGANRDYLLFNTDCMVALKDPDVVALYDHGEFYAIVAGIDPNGFIRTYRFHTASHTGPFELVSCCRYGAAWLEDKTRTGPGGELAPQSGYSLGRLCSSPNLDCNADGDVVLVWTETESFRVEAQLGFPFTATNFYLDFTRGNVMAVTGDMTETGCLTGCSDDERAILFWENWFDNEEFPFDFAGQNIVPGRIIGASSADEVFNPDHWYAASDVAISERGEGTDPTVITYVFHQYETLGSGHILRIVQEGLLSTGCEPRTDWTGSFNTQQYYGTPRIAMPARTGYGGEYDDFTVVLDHEAYQGCDTNGYFNFAPIYALGVYNGTRVNAGNPLIINNDQDIQDLYNNHPVVAYNSQRATREQGVGDRITVAWTHADQPWLPTTLSSIIALQLDPGTLQPLTGNDEYSETNDNLIRENIYPSIAGRHARFNQGYLYFWHNSARNNLHHKASTNEAGSEVLTSNTGACIEQPPNEERPAVKVIPNPSSGLIYYSISTEQAAPILELQLINSQGTVVKKVQGNNSKPSFGGQLEKGGLPPGLYSLKLRTAKGVFTHPVSFQ